MKIKLFLLVAMALMLSCSTVSSLFVSDADEEKLGAEFHLQYMDSLGHTVYSVGNDTAKIAFKNYVVGVFQSMLQAADEDMPNYKKNFTFTIINDDVQNAFAVPGGYVYIYTGIIKSMQTEAELAGVLGHEIAHVTQHHYRRSVAGQAAIGTILNAVAGEEAGALTQFVLGAMGVLSGSYISRGNETESDTKGTEYLHLSKRNPRGIASYFSRQDARGGLHTAVSSHPDSPDRVAKVNELVTDEGYTTYDSDQYKYQTRFQNATAILGK